MILFLDLVFTTMWEQKEHICTHSQNPEIIDRVKHRLSAFMN